MELRFRKIVLATLVMLSGLFTAEHAEAFRCGNKLVTDGLHEQQVVNICGQPTTMRQLGYAVRGYDPRRRYRPGLGWSETHDRGYHQLSEEIIITEYVYNFGSRKLMQRLIFEGGILVTIEPLGYGYPAN